MRVPASPLLRLVLSLGLFTAGLAPRVALCLGSDGHREVEALDAACCRPGSNRAEAMVDPCARGCTDVPLSVAMGARAPEHGGLTIERAAAVLPDAPQPSQAPTWAFARVSAIPWTECAQHLRSTVLLC